jgi:hypothetical protein
MALLPKHKDNHNHKDKAEHEAPKTGPRASTKEAEEVNDPSHLEPYPTGNPPDPMEVYDEAHPERSVDWGTYPPEPPPEARSKKEK